MKIKSCYFPEWVLKFAQELTDMEIVTSVSEGLRLLVLQGIGDFIHRYAKILPKNKTESLNTTFNFFENVDSYIDKKVKNVLVEWMINKATNE